jgi:hypothetical protein
MFKSALSIGFVFMAATIVAAQDNDIPSYIGSENSFENYFLKRFRAVQETTNDVCDTSIGFVEFQIDTGGHVTSVLIPPNFPERVVVIIETVIRNSKWAQVSTKRNDRQSIPMILPLYISIETGCKPGDIKRKFGLEKDFRMMFPGLEEKKLKTCFVMQPLTYVVPSGFQD